jgi:hypothetical protein
MACITRACYTLYVGYAFLILWLTLWGADFTRISLQAQSHPSRLTLVNTGSRLAAKFNTPLK